MKKLLILGLAATGFVAPFAEATAHETAPQRVVVPVNGTTAVLPATVRINETVVVTRRHHRRYRTVRRTVIRNGRRTTVVRRVYY